MSDVEEVNKVKELLLHLCEAMQDLAKDGIRVEFKIDNAHLTEFHALKEMKLSS